MATRVLVGTCGYSYADWVGPFYPTGTRPGEYLAFYAAEFDFVELDFPFYRQPDPNHMRRMADRVGERFRFAVKAHRGITHDRKSDLAGESLRFREGIEPLRSAGKLEAVLVQFPYSFHYTPDSRRRLDEILRRLEGLPLAVEFRNSEWQQQRVVDELRRRRVVPVSVDLPGLARLPRPTLAETDGRAYLRLHGRNKRNWWAGDNVTRYDYLYGADELRETWIRPHATLLRDLQLLIVAFNNHHRGQAVQNARLFRKLVAENGLGDGADRNRAGRESAHQEDAASKALREGT